MTTGIRITYGEMRSNAEKLADEQLKARILRGIEVLNKKFGPDWVDHIDPGTLDLASPNACVLGQVYDGAEIPANRYTPTEDGYWRGLILINGDVEANPEMYGFASDSDDDDDDWEEDVSVSYSSLTSAWRVALGAEA